MLGIVHWLKSQPKAFANSVVIFGFLSCPTGFPERFTNVVNPTDIIVFNKAIMMIKIFFYVWIALKKCEGIAWRKQKLSAFRPQLLQLFDCSYPIGRNDRTGQAGNGINFFLAYHLPNKIACPFAPCAARWHRPMKHLRTCAGNKREHCTHVISLLTIAG